MGKGALGVLCDTSEGLFCVDPADLHVGWSLQHRGAWAQDNLRRLLSHVTPDSRVLVLGAHVGALAIPIARRCRELVAFEANPRTFRLFEINLRLNSISNCRAYQLAAGEKKGSIQFTANTANSGGSKRKPLVDHFMYRYDDPQQISVDMVAVDDFLEDHRFDLVIIDIEGSEYFALQGMQSTLEKTELLQIEYLPHHLANVSGATPDSFARLLEPHFSWVGIDGEPNMLSTKGLAPFLTTLKDRDFFGDLIFRKTEAQPS